MTTRRDSRSEAAGAYHPHCRATPSLLERDDPEDGKVEDLYAEPRECLTAALPHLHEAPISEPEAEVTDVVTGKVTPIEKGRK
jgi:hypothetical protein